MSTNVAGFADKVQLIDNRIGPFRFSASGGSVSAEKGRVEPAFTSADLCTSATSRSSGPAAFAGAFLGCLATLYLSAFGVVPAIASALITTLLGGLLLTSRPTVLLAREFVPGVFGGAFGGMTSIHWPSDIGSHHPIMSAGALFISLSIVCGLAFSAGAVFNAHSCRRPANGYGGRSGAIAAVACACFVQLAVLCGADESIFHAARANLTESNLGSLATVFAACLTGTLASLLVLRRERVAASDLADKMFVASAIALAGLIIIRRFSPNDALLLDAFYAGCFLGMSSRERLNGCMETMLGAVVLTGLIVQVGIVLPGIGGGLGLAAFVTVAVLVISKQFKHFVLPVNRSENMATQLPAVCSPAGHSLVKLRVERRRGTWLGVSWRPAAAIAGLAVCAAVVSGLIWPARFVSKESVSVATASMLVVDEEAKASAAPQAEVLSSAVDAATQLGIAEANPDPTASDRTALQESPSETGATGSVAPKLVIAAVEERAAGSEEPKTAPPIVTEVIAAHEPERSEAQTTENDATEAALFREFLQWRAARVSGAAPNAQRNAAERHNLLLPAPRPTAVATNSQPRSRPPSSAGQAQPTTSPVAHPRRPHPGNTTRAAAAQVAPASAASGRPISGW